MKHFKLSEFACPCCGKSEMDNEFLAMLDMAREKAGIPFKINSGFRCKKHNADVEGKPDSAHLYGKAVDIHCLMMGERMRIVKALLDVGFKRIGINKTFIHVDTDTKSKPLGVFLY